MAEARAVPGQTWSQGRWPSDDLYLFTGPGASRVRSAWVYVIQSPASRQSGNISSVPLSERWVTDDDLLAARERFANQVSGYRQPVAYSVARLDDGQLTFGHINDPTSDHRLPAVVLASFCGYTNRTGTFPLSTDDFSRAVAALSPAEAATHWQHPNLWSWRRLLEEARPESTFIAFYVTAIHDPVTDEHDATFRSLLPGCEQNVSATDYAVGPGASA